jgi:DNA-binding MarR family transcriptional regulator
MSELAQMDELAQKAFIFAEIFAVSNKLQALGDKLDRQITIKQWLLLAAISKSAVEAPSISEISALIGTSRQNVKKMALLLEKQGFVNIRKDPNDARVLRVVQTAKCVEHFRARYNMELEFLEKLFSGLDGALLSGLCNGLIKLTDNISIMEAQKQNEEQ